MRSDHPLPGRQTAVLVLALAGLLATTAPVCAQGLGLGARIAWVHPDTDVDVDAVRYFGGQVRLLGPRLGLEVALDHHSEELDALNQKVTETPIQISFMLRGSGRVSPFLLGGPGWYHRSVKPLDSTSDLSVSTTEFGWHAGIGLEILASKHFGVHGDYRYTFLDFHNDNNDGGILGVSKLLPGHRGSMWTLGATFYF